MAKNGKAASSKETSQPNRAGGFPVCRLLIGALLALVIVAPLAAQTIQNPKRIRDGLPGQVLVLDAIGSVYGVDKDSLQPVWSYQEREFWSPFSLAHRHNLVFVGDTDTRNVGVYRIARTRTADGTLPTLEFLYNLGHTAPGQIGMFENPVDIVVDSRRPRVFVLDSHAKKVFLFDLRGNLQGSFVPKGPNGVVLSPVAMNLDQARQQILISDYGDPRGFFRISRAARILIFNYDGTLAGQITGDGRTHSSTKFLRPQGIAADSLGRLFVSDTIRSRIIILDRATGATLGELTGEGSPGGPLRLPLGLHLDATTGDLYVADGLSPQRLHVFRGAGRTP